MIYHPDDNHNNNLHHFLFLVLFSQNEDDKTEPFCYHQRQKKIMMMTKLVVIVGKQIPKLVLDHNLEASCGRFNNLRPTPLVLRLGLNLMSGLMP